MSSNTSGNLYSGLNVFNFIAVFCRLNVLLAGPCAENCIAITMGNTRNSLNDQQPEPLTHWGQDKMAAVSQTTLSNAFSWMKL